MLIRRRSFLTTLLSCRAYIDELEKFRNTKLRVGYTAGAFDLFHRGHMHILREARKHCDFLVVSVNADHHIAQNKGPDRPVWVRENRAYAVANTDVVSSVLLCDPDYIGQTGKYRLSDIEHQILKPDVAFFGSDYNIDTIPEHRRVWAPETCFH